MYELFVVNLFVLLHKKNFSQNNKNHGKFYHKKLIKREFVSDTILHIL